jgi:hypothetical protein
MVVQRVLDVQAARGSGSASHSQPLELPYSQFVALAQDGLVHSAVVDEGGSTLQFNIDSEAYNRKLAKQSQRWYHRKPVATEEQQKMTRNTPCSTRVVDKDVSFVKVRPIAVARRNTSNSHWCCLVPRVART